MIQWLKSKQLIAVIVLLSSAVFFKSIAEEPRGEEMLKLYKFDSAIRDFSAAIEKGESQKAIEQFLKVMKLKPNAEIIQKISELSGIKRLYPLAYHKDYEWSPIFSPDGQKIVYQGWQKAKAKTSLLKDVIFAMNIDGTKEEALTSDEYDNFSPVFSPDGRYIAFYSVKNDTNEDRTINKKDNRSINIIEMNTKKEWRIVSDIFANSFIGFTLDSKKVLFYSFREDTNSDGKKDFKDDKGIYIVNTGGSAEEKIISYERYNNMSVLTSPDSRIAVYESIRIDSNKDGKIDSSDNPGIYMKEISGTSPGEEELLVPPEYKNEIAVFTPDSKSLVFFSRRKDTNKDKAIDENDKRSIHIVNINNKKERLLISDGYDHDFASFSRSGKKMAYTSFLRDTNADGIIDSIDHKSIMIYDLSLETEGFQVVGDTFDNAFLAFYPDDKKIIFQSWRKDNDNNGQIDILDQPGVYIIDIGDAPTMRIETVIKRNGSGTRVIEVVMDPLFRETAKYQEMFLKDKKWEIGFMKEGGFHLKAVGDFKRPDELASPDYPMSYKRKNGLFKSICEFREVLPKQEATENSTNPFINFGKEMSKSMARPLVIVSRITVPGKIISTNSPLVSGNTLEWTIPIGSLLKANRDYEMVVKVEMVNWSAISIMGFFGIIIFGGIGYRVYGSRIAQQEKLKQLSREYAEAHNYLGIAYKNKNLYNESLEEFKKALSFSPKSAIIHYNMALSFALKGEKEQAKNYLQKAVVLDSSLKLKSDKEEAFKGL